MYDKVLLIDIDKCIGCYACEVACKQENNLPLSSRWCVVNQIDPRKIEDEMHMDFVPTVCIHCDDPACSYFCTPGAIEKKEDGMVAIDGKKCTGCGLCVYGCPYGAMYFNKEERVAGKCSLCASRIEDGLEPSCVQHCTGGALQFVTREELSQITEGMHTAGSDKVRYTSSKWKLSLNRGENPKTPA